MFGAVNYDLLEKYLQLISSFVLSVDSPTFNTLPKMGHVDVLRVDKSKRNDL